MIDRLVQEILRVGRDDWVPLAVVASLARQHGASTDAEARELGLAAMRAMVESGLAVIGHVSDQGFMEWSGPLDTVLAQIAQAWRTTDRNTWGFACWLQNTPSGDTRANMP